MTFRSAGRESDFPSLQPRTPAYLACIMSSSPLVLAAFGLGSTELLVILLIVLVLFGGSKLPSLAKGLGQSVKEFKKASKDDDETKPTEVKKTEAESTKTPTGSN
jgi:sec-independent protein translocase protein TatA